MTNIENPNIRYTKLQSLISRVCCFGVCAIIPVDSTFIRCLIEDTSIHKVVENRYTPPTINQRMKPFFGSPDRYVSKAVDISRTPPPESSVSSFRKSIARFLTAGGNSSFGLFSMERFSFQRMVKGMQLRRCPAILGETLHPFSRQHIGSFL